MDKLLTVIVPVFNDETNIIRCLESLFNQTLKNIEIIIINDASTDDTLTILNNYQISHPIQVINMQKNIGAGACRNKGILTASTPYVTFVDSDDWVDISSYARCFEQIRSNTDKVELLLSKKDCLDDRIEW